MAERHYTDEEAKEILRRAIASEEPGAVGHDDLIAAAEEVGISREAVEEAIAEVQIISEVDQMVLRRRARRRRGFWRSLGFYVVVNGFLFALDAVTPGGPWFHWPLLGWGLMMALSALKVFFPDDERDHREAARALSRRKAQEERERRKRERKRKNRDLEDVIEDGVEMLLGALASGVKAAIDGGASRADGEFKRYVDRRHAHDGKSSRRSDEGDRGPADERSERRRRDSPPPTGVRVAENEEAPEEIENEERERKRRP